MQQSEQSLFSVSEIKLLAKKYEKNLPLIVATLERWQNLLLPIQNKTFPNSRWAQIFAEILQTLGWPGENNLTDIEKTAVEHFTKSLQEYAATSLILGNTTSKKALQIFQEIVGVTYIQSTPEVDAPINIIGTLEAAGINFDYLWVMGIDEENWPATPKPNPFIPMVIQKKLSLPHATAERELLFAETLIKRYKRSAQEIIFSYVKQSKDHPIAPSLLIADLPEIITADLKLPPTRSWSEKIYHSQKLTIIEADPAPKLAPNEITHAPSRLLELQSSCPFRAFIEFRLKTSELKKPHTGISKINRGILIHNTLEQFWQKVKTNQNLCALNQNELEEIILGYIKNSLNRLTLSPPLYKLEKEVLFSLITKILMIEKEREPFKVIATEKLVSLTLASIPFKLRIDRIDQCADGKILLLDYKTGRHLPSIFDWFGLRPKNLQLPLYSLAIDNIAGLALVHIHSASTKFKDVNLKELALSLNTLDPSNNIQGNMTWPKLTKYWYDILAQIAHDFASGTATVAPATPQTCRQCSFDSVCRITRSPGQTGVA